MERGLELTGPLAGERQAALTALLARRELAPRQRERLEMVKAAWLGETMGTIARWSGRTPRTVRRWLRVFRAGGAAALAGAPIPGRPPRADRPTWRPWRRRWRPHRVRWGCRSMSGPRPG